MGNGAGISFEEFKRVLVLATIMVIKKADPNKSKSRRKRKTRGINGITLNRKMNDYGGDDDIGHVST
jgi:hypothetical protein